MYALLSNVYTKIATDSLLSTINNNITLKANQPTTYTRLETYGKTETYTKTEIMGSIQPQYSVVAPLSMGINLISGKYMICMSPAYYASLDAKLNNTTGDVAIAIRSNYGVDVAVFSNNATKDVELKRNSYVSNNFSVLGTSTFGNTLFLSMNSGGGGGIRVVAATAGSEASIGYYNRSDLRSTVAGDMWVCGINCWSRTGYNIGSPILNSCLNIFDTGTITTDYKIRTPLLMTDTIRGNGANQITIDDNVIITGNFVLNGSFNYKHFWVAGNIDGSNLIISGSKGRYPFTISRPAGYSVRVYYINCGTNPCSDANYVINITLQTNGFCKVWKSSIPTVNGFHIIISMPLMYY